MDDEATKSDVGAGERQVERLGQYVLEKISKALDPRELRIRGEAGLAEMADQAQRLMASLRPGQTKVRVLNTTHMGIGRTVLQVLCPDQPFLVDTFRMSLPRLGLRELMFMHTLLAIERDADGAIARVGNGGQERSREAYLCAEVSSINDSARRDEIEAELGRLFRGVSDVVADHGHMVKALRKHTAEIEFGSDNIEGGHQRTRELMDFLAWLADENFVFLGYRRYEVRKRDGEWSIDLDRASGLGLLRDPEHSRFSNCTRGEAIPALIRTRLADPRLMFFDKSRRASQIHREGRLDAISVKVFGEDGQVAGFGKFLGLLTHKAIRTRASAIPILRARRQRVLEELGEEEGSHTYKAAVEIYDSLPPEFILSFEVGDVTRTIQQLLRAQENRSIEIAVITDQLNRSFFVSVTLPRSAYRDSLREELHALLRESYGVNYLDHRITFLDDEAALIHFFCSCSDDVDLRRLERLGAEIKRCAMTWEDRFEAALLESYPDQRAFQLADEYGLGFPEEYRVVTRAEDARSDVEHLERLASGASGAELAFLTTEDPSQPSKLKIYQHDRPYLTDLLPRLDQFGLRVLDANLTEVRGHSGDTRWIAAFPIERFEGSADVRSKREARVLDGLRRVLAGSVEADTLNSLILGVDLDWREVELLRAYLAYANQLENVTRRRFVSETLLRYPEATRALLALFRARFDPDLPGPTAEREAAAGDALTRAREPIPTAEEDRVFGLLEQLIRASLRTNYFAPGDEQTIVFKLDPRRIEVMPSPRPWVEIFVHSAQFCGVHLRGGRVARGGIRWSDRLQDYRTEILGLMKTQMVKNGLIVPVGAKGGFVLKHWYSERSVARAEADRQYARFIGALLSLTDNVVGDSVVHPKRVVCHDGDDPYLVVAADKGTAHLSDTANAAAEAAGFWLADAFASGGSQGYDHKVEAITARGVWTCIKQHFLEMGVDLERDSFSCAGIGDMSGDVFGNGMLLLRRARVLAAFNHEHIFLDPDPDPEIAWAERRRLFGLPRSTWKDYDTSKISSGGGVYDRAAKAVRLSPEAREALSVDVDTLSGEGLVRAILCMPVDLLWNGGVGTYVKSSQQSHADVGDRTNDAVRVDACELRARVIGEGGNLGMTQLARVEYALCGGRGNTDALDNSGGVNLSDLEVNYKILLAKSCAGGKMTRDERNRVLRDCVGQADASVLANNAAQVRCVSMDLLRSRVEPERLVAAADFLEQRGGLDRAIEFMPTWEELRARSTALNVEVGYTRPELAVLLGYTKLLIKRELSASELLDHASFRPVLEGYFPDTLRERFPEEIGSHKLRREITATCLTNRVIDRAGVTLVPELIRTTGAGLAEIIVAYHLANHMLEADHLRWEIERQDVPELLRLEAALCVERAVRAATRSRLGLERRVCLEPEELGHWTGMVRSLRDLFRAGQGNSDEAAIDARAATWTARGLARELAIELERLPGVVRALGVIPLAMRSDAALPHAVRLHAAIGHETRIAWLLDRLAELDGRDAWDRVAGESLTLELLEVQRRLTAALIESDCLEAFRSANSATLRQIGDTAAQIESEERKGLAPLAVLAQLIRRLS